MCVRVTVLVRKEGVGGASERRWLKLKGWGLGRKMSLKILPVAKAGADQVRLVPRLLAVLRMCPSLSLLNFLPTTPSRVLPPHVVPLPFFLNLVGGW